MAGGMERGRAAGPLPKGVLYYSTHLAANGFPIFPKRNNEMSAVRGAFCACYAPAEP